jgi:plasmid stabilization system protein ParE
MKYEVRILARAQDDIARCYDYIAGRSARGAKSWLSKLAATRDRLALNPERRPLAAESAHVDYEIREVFFKTRKGNPYRVLFTIREGKVLVLRVRGQGQDYIPAHELPLDPSSR